jgi:hypothetical protein
MTEVIPDRARHPRAAALAALAFGFVAFVVSVAEGVIGVVYTQGSTLESLDGFDYAGPAFQSIVPYAAGRILPMAVGVYLSFWLAAPLRPLQAVSHVIVRTLVALAIGLAISIGFEAVRLLTSDSPVNPFTQGGQTDNRYYILVAGGLAHDAWRLFVDTFAIVVAVGLATWGWMRPRAPLVTSRDAADSAIAAGGA